MNTKTGDDISGKTVKVENRITIHIHTSQLQVLYYVRGLESVLLGIFKSEFPNVLQNGHVDA